MNRFAPVSLALVLAACAAPAPPPAAAAPSAPSAPSASPAEAPSAPSAPAPAVRATDARPSLYELDIALVDQHGKPRHFDTFRGHPTLLAMFYATCPSACPVLLNSIREMEKSLPEADRARLRVLLVSLDPAHDTPAVLADAGKLHGADPERWALCRAEPNDVRTLAAVLGVRYRAEKDGSIDHSSAVTLLSADGVVIAKVEGLGQSLEPIAAALHGGGPS